jgi:tripartite-type tricarboxylate transporter receptor subunit TctC
VVDRYARAVGEVIRAPDMKQRLEQMGLEPTGSGPAELGTLLKADYEKWGPVIRASGFKPTQ